MPSNAEVLTQLEELAEAQDGKTYVFWSTCLHADFSAILGALKRLVAREQRAVELLQGVVDDEQCQLDHHGVCQTHWGSPCGMAQIRAFLAESGPRTGEAMSDVTVTTILKRGPLEIDRCEPSLGAVYFELLLRRPGGSRWTLGEFDREGDARSAGTRVAASFRDASAKWRPM